MTVMNAAARLIGGLGWYDRITPVLRDTLHMVADTVVTVLAFDSVRGTCPSYFRGVCAPLSEVSGRARLHSAQHGDLLRVSHIDQTWQTQSPSCCMRTIKPKRLKLQSTNLA